MKKASFIFASSVVLLGSAVVFLGGCGKDSDKVVARAGNVKITREDFTKEISNSPSAYLSYLSTLEGKKQFLDILLKEKILVNAAEKSGISRKQEFRKNIKDYETRVREQTAEYRKGLILREYLRELKDGELKVSEPEVKSYFDQNKTDYQNPVKVTASHILCFTPEEANVALQRVKKGENFAQVAHDLSKDPTASRGGMIGEVAKGDLADLPEFEEELFNLKKGEVSGVVKTKIGYHVIRKDGESHSKGQDYDEAIPQIRRILEKKKFDQWMDKVKKDQKVWVDEKVLASVPTPSAAEEPSPSVMETPASARK